MRKRLVFAGHDLRRLSDRGRRALVGKDVAMIFQDPTTSLNPCFTIGFQLAETLRLHLKLDRDGARRRAIELLEQVGIPAPATRLGDFPHQLSGGMNQRVMIAMAIACNPRLLIADEPTTALDVTIQAQILDLLRALQRERGMALILVTHNMGVVAEMARRVAVMYAGQIVEERAAGASPPPSIPTRRRFSRPCRSGARAMRASRRFPASFPASTTGPRAVSSRLAARTQPAIPAGRGRRFANGRADTSAATIRWAIRSGTPRSRVTGGSRRHEPGRRRGEERDAGL